VPVLQIRNRGSFRQSLKEKLEKGPKIRMEDEAGLGPAIHWIQQALISYMRATVLLDLSEKVGKI